MVKESLFDRWSRCQRFSAGCLVAVVVLTVPVRVCAERNVLDVRTLTKYVDPLVNPLDHVIAPTGTLSGAPLYEVGISQFQQRLHRDLPPTTVWGYNGIYPGPTFNIHRGETINVRWTNSLTDGLGTPLDHLLPYDTTVHGAGPSFPEARVSTHVHGAVTDEASDGFPEHWFTASPPGRRPSLQSLYVTSVIRRKTWATDDE